MDDRVLVDADVLVYWTAFAMQKMRYYYEGEMYPDYAALLEHLAAKGLKPNQVEYDKELEILPDDRFPLIASRAIEMIEKQTGSTNLEFYLSGDTNFRTEVATIKEYKGNRTADKPVKYEMAKDYFTSMAKSVSVNEEADDVIAIAQIDSGCKCIIATIDKDLNQIPGRHFDWGKELKYTVGQDDGDRYFWTQMLTGDRADNIPGIPRVGDKTAAKLLDGMDASQRIDLVTSKYRETYGTGWEDALTEVGQLLWMRRAPGQMWTLDKHEEYSKL